jgi:Asp-tRNA(Asn)/Glu-tRNA(Gln) amidotransferase A subunit family amidase
MEACDLSATEARSLIGTKALSPVELMTSCIRRIEEVNHAVNAVVTRDFDRALDTARMCEAAVMRGESLGTLHGLPVGIKDTFNAAGLRTTCGSPILTDNIPVHDDGFVADLRQAGAIVIGKTNVPEWAAGANTRNPVFGATGNPFDPTKSVAGSSGGSAAALACGMMPIASGSDTGGSLRNPAAFCGIVGFRPSPGLIAAEKRGMAWFQISTLGPMARTVADVRLMMNSMLRGDARDPLSALVNYDGGPRILAKRPVDLSRLRVAFTPDFGFAPTENRIAEVFRDKTNLFRSTFGAAADATPDCSGSDNVFAVLRATVVLGTFRKLREDHPGLIGPNLSANIDEGYRYSSVDIADAFVAQTELHRRWQTFFRDFDIIISPSITISPRPWAELYPASIDGVPTRSYFHWLALAYAVTVVGHPAISIPLGVDDAGMPFGLQIVGPRGGDAFVLDVAENLSEVLARNDLLARPSPDIARLKTAQPISRMDNFLGWGDA